MFQRSPARVSRDGEAARAEDDALRRGHACRCRPCQHTRHRHPELESNGVIHGAPRWRGFHLQHPATIAPAARRYQSGKGAGCIPGWSDGQDVRFISPADGSDTRCTPTVEHCGSGRGPRGAPPRGHAHAAVGAPGSWSCLRFLGLERPRPQGRTPPRPCPRGRGRSRAGQALGWKAVSMRAMAQRRTANGYAEACRARTRSRFQAPRSRHTSARRFSQPGPDRSRCRGAVVQCRLICRSAGLGQTIAGRQSSMRPGSGTGAPDLLARRQSRVWAET